MMENAKDPELLERIEDAADLKEIRSRLANPAGKPIPIKEAADRLGVKGF